MQSQTISSLGLTPDDSPRTLVEYATGDAALWIEHAADGWTICDDGQCVAIGDDANLTSHAREWVAAVEHSLDASPSIVALRAPTDCVYCLGDVSPDDAELVPSVDDDNEWARLAAQHEADCEWIATRAHRRDAAS